MFRAAIAAATCGGRLEVRTYSRSRLVHFGHIIPRSPPLIGVEVEHSGAAPGAARTSPPVSFHPVVEIIKGHPSAIKTLSQPPRHKPPLGSAPTPLASKLPLDGVFEAVFADEHRVSILTRNGSCQHKSPTVPQEPSRNPTLPWHPPSPRSGLKTNPGAF